MLPEIFGLIQCIVIGCVIVFTLAVGRTAQKMGFVPG